MINLLLKLNNKNNFFEKNGEQVQISNGKTLTSDFISYLQDYVHPESSNGSFHSEVNTLQETNGTDIIDHYYILVKNKLKNTTRMPIASKNICNIKILNIIWYNILVAKISKLNLEIITLIITF